MVKRLGLAQTAAMCTLGVVVMAAAGCSMFERPPKPVRNWTIAEARAFDEFQLYWVGPQYEGLPLTYVGRSVDGDEVTHITFAYGEPSCFGDAASGSWLSPLEIDIQPYCGFLRHEVVSEEDLDDLGIEPDSSSDVKIGDAVGRVSRYDFWNYLYVRSGDSFIDISTDGHASFDIEQPAGDLIAITEETGATPGSLPPPATAEC